MKKLARLSLLLFVTSGCAAAELNKLGRTIHLESKGPSAAVRSGDDLVLLYECRSGTSGDEVRSCTEKLSLEDVMTEDSDERFDGIQYSRLEQFHAGASLPPGEPISIQVVPALELATIPSRLGECQVFRAPSIEKNSADDTETQMSEILPVGAVLIRCRTRQDRYCERSSRSVATSYVNERAWWSVPAKTVLAVPAVAYDTVTAPFYVASKSSVHGPGAITVLLYPIAVPLSTYTSARLLVDADRELELENSRATYKWVCRNYGPAPASAAR